MDSQPRAFESLSGMEAGTPLRCPRVMQAQPIVVTTPVSLAGTMATALLALPRALLLAPEMLRMRHRA